MEEDSDVDSRTIFCGNLSPKVTEDILYELFLQGGPVERVKIPMNNGRQANYGFVTYKHACSVEYALEIYKDTELYGCLLNLKKRNVRNQNTTNDRELVIPKNENFDNSVLQGGNFIQMTNMQYMMPQTFGNIYPNNMLPNMYYQQPQKYDHDRRSPPRNRHHNRNQPHHSTHQMPSGRYDNDRHHRRYDDYKSRHNDRRDRKRHKR